MASLLSCAFVFFLQIRRSIRSAPPPPLAAPFSCAACRSVLTLDSPLWLSLLLLSVVMGTVCGTQKDIWVVIYEKGVADAARVQQRALRMTVEGQLSGYKEVNTPLGGSPLTSAGSGVPLLARHTAKVAQVAEGARSAESSLAVMVPSGWMSAASSVASDGGNANNHNHHNHSRAPPAPSAAAPPKLPQKEPSTQDKFNAIRQYVEQEWTAKDRRELRTQATKLWKQYHKPFFPPVALPPGAKGPQPTRGAPSPYLQLSELVVLTSDSLRALQGHMQVFIQTSYEEMKRNTMIGMINLMTKGYTAKSLQAQQSNQSSAFNVGGGGGAGGVGGTATLANAASAVAAASGGAAAASFSASSSGGGSSGSTFPLSHHPQPWSGGLALSDVTWLNEQVDARKLETMRGLNAQIEEWIEHAHDIAEAIYLRMDPAKANRITRKQFVDNFGQAIYEVVGPNFFRDHLPAVGS